MSNEADLAGALAALDAVLVDIGGTLVAEAAPGTPTSDLRVTLLPNVLADLGAFALHVRVGAVTNTAVMTEAHVRELVGPCGLSDLLEVLVTSFDVGVPKPDPLPLVRAMAQLGLADPGRILYIGNEATDAAAAAAAGMHYVDIGAGDLADAVRRWHETMIRDR